MPVERKANKAIQIVVQTPLKEIQVKRCMQVLRRMAKGFWSGKRATILFWDYQNSIWIRLIFCGRAARFIPNWSILSNPEGDKQVSDRRLKFDGVLLSKGQQGIILNWLIIKGIQWTERLITCLHLNWERELYWIKACPSTALLIRWKMEALCTRGKSAYNFII